MTFHSKLEGFEPPPFKENFRKPPIRKSKYTEEEKKQKRKEANARCNAKRDANYIKQANDKQRAKNTESFQNSIKKARRKILDKRTKELEELAGREKPLNCEVCNDTGKICFDHCHTNNHFRGWLCDRCNRILGQAKDDPEILKKLALYLENDLAKLSPEHEDNDDIPF